MVSERDLKRYDRQIRLFGAGGQECLKDARAFIAGAGGLGSPIAVYLAAAGIGEIVIVDKDTVELSNLNRQILHWEKDIGEKKATSAQEKLLAMNSDIRVEAICDTLDEQNILDLAKGSDLIIDAMDNYPTRYLLNRISLKMRVPFLHGAVNGFYGQATTILPGRSACLRCIFARPPPPSPVPVVGVTPGIIGLIQATEAIKFLTGTGELLAGKLLIWDGLRCSTDTIDVQRDPQCTDCGSLEG
ncbi:MAG TPA: HesA/MoeB/ThiF family protein [Methanothrix sp.]|nr:HesA/MoeB/ThiF family protein [Methanothrix sp.]